MSSSSEGERTALVTGGSRGIGAGIAKRLARDGFAVVVNYRAGAAEAARVIAEITAAGGRATAVQADVALESRAADLVQRAIAWRGRLDVVVNNAGIGEFRPLSESDCGHLDRVFAVNVRGAMAVSQPAAKHMIQQRSGCIINISSGAAKAAGPGTAVYSASKAAVDVMTRSWAAELGQFNIRVNGIAPGLTESDMLSSLISTEVQREMVGSTALGRLGTPDDIAAVAAFLASDDARWITGEIIGVNGGLR